MAVRRLGGSLDWLLNGFFEGGDGNMSDGFVLDLVQWFGLGSTCRHGQQTQIDEGKGRLGHIREALLGGAASSHSTEYAPYPP